MRCCLIRVREELAERFSAEKEGLKKYESDPWAGKI